MRADKAKSLSKVKKALAINPLLTDREIANDTGIGKSTVNRAIKEMGQLGTKDENIVKITDTDREIIEKAQIIVIESLDKHIELSQAWGWLSLQEALQASNLAKESTARYSLFRWSATDNSGWLNDIWTILWMIQGIN